MNAVIRVFLSVLAVALVAAAQSGDRFSWQDPQAKITAEGDLQWAPAPFVFHAGSSVRYIDYENGNDDNPGNRARPWKHHPWDTQASGRAAQCTGIQTYVFKRGVVYRGSLVAKESGRAGDPIRLTSDPSWGKGEAGIYGSKRITGGWTRGSAQSAPGIPSPESVWYKDIGTDFTPHSVWMLDGGGITRIALAREPNWKMSNPDDVKSEWYQWDKAELTRESINGKEGAHYWMADSAHLTATGKDAYVGGTVWTEYDFVMSEPYGTLIEAYDPERHAVRVIGPYGPQNIKYGPVAHCRYYLENLPQFLDTPGEYYLVDKGALAGRLFLRLPEDRDPNSVVIEIAQRPVFLDIREQNHIHVSGLTFRFQNVVTVFDSRGDPPPDETYEVDSAGVKALGACQDIRVTNCKFEHIVRAFMVGSGPRGITDQMAFDDNDIQYSDYGPILVKNRAGTPPEGNLYRVEILRNRLKEVGRRPIHYDQGHAMQVYGALLPEIAGNILDRCYGAGIFVFGGKAQRPADVRRPLSRVLIYHNKVTDSLLNINDYGGIEFWQNGPAYIYGNISGNPGGYRYWRDLAGDRTAEKRTHMTARFGFAYYLDGGFKSYVFNNVAWGKSSDLTSPLCATSAFHEVVGFMNAFFNNTIYLFAAPFRKQTSFGGHSAYMGNLVMDTSEVVFRHSDITLPDDTKTVRTSVRHYPTETVAYANNVFTGQPRVFGYFDLNKSHATLEDFGAGLAKDGALASQTGWQAEASPVRNAGEHDFRPRAGSAVIDRGVKYFVPWSLNAVVGEWQFYRLPADPTRILGENWNPTEEYAQRDMYYRIPRNDLKAYNVSAGDYVKGTLEDWTEGALTLNGRDQYCALPDAELRTANGRSPSRNLDMDTNNFLVEAVFRTTPARTGGSLVSKLDTAGYAVEIDKAGRVRMRLQAGAGEKNEYSRTSLVPVNDGKWHHLIAEVDRGAAEGIRIYLDGKSAGGRFSGTLPAPNASLTNAADFLVGKGPGGDFFAGAIDYLRVSRGTLADARTSIEELYRWEFDGPFLTDFRGKAPTGVRRDAGAFEYAP